MPRCAHRMSPAEPSAAVPPAPGRRRGPEQGRSENGSMASVCAMTEVFVKERQHTLTGKMEKVTIDDACIFFGKFANGSLANFESTRYARGHKAQYTLEINGENMSIFWDLHDLHRLS